MATEDKPHHKLWIEGNKLTAGTAYKKVCEQDVEVDIDLNDEEVSVTTPYGKFSCSYRHEPFYFASWLMNAIYCRPDATREELLRQLRLVFRELVITRQASFAHTSPRSISSLVMMMKIAYEGGVGNPDDTMRGFLYEVDSESSEKSHMLQLWDDEFGEFYLCPDVDDIYLVQALIEHFSRQSGYKLAIDRALGRGEFAGTNE